MSAVLDRRVNDCTGKEEYLVKRGSGSGSAMPSDVTSDAARVRVREGALWETREALVLDGAGACYGERGGQYGIHGDGSTRERLATFRKRQWALDRFVCCFLEMQLQLHSATALMFWFTTIG